MPSVTLLLQAKGYIEVQILEIVQCQSFAVQKRERREYEEGRSAFNL
jgi:hypothetical protein